MTNIINVKSPTLKKIVEYRMLYVMILPALAFYAIFCYGPMYGILMAFKDYSVSKGIWGSDWVRFKYFEQILSLPKFWSVFGNTLWISILKLVICFPAPIALALFINEARSVRFKKIVQTIIYLPHFVSWVTISGIIVALFSVNNGLINNIIVSLNGQKIDILTNPDLFRPLLILSDLWKEVGWGTIIYFAVICSVPSELYEAAVMDGAKRRQQIWHITLPSIMPTITILFILALGNITNSNFDQIFNLYNPMVYEKGDVLSTYIYRMGISQGKFSVATAMGLMLNTINFILLFTSNKVIKRIGGSGIY